MGRTNYFSIFRIHAKIPSYSKFSANRARASASVVSFEHMAQLFGSDSHPKAGSYAIAALLFRPANKFNSAWAILSDSSEIKAIP